jgi:hypothetical protein
MSRWPRWSGSPLDYPAVAFDFADPSTLVGVGPQPLDIDELVGEGRGGVVVVVLMAGVHVLHRCPWCSTAAHAADTRSHAYAHADASGRHGGGCLQCKPSSVTAKVTANSQDNTVHDG